MLILAAIAGYLIGSIPMAFLVTKSLTGLDLRREGSRNIGTLNSYEVTGKRSVGFLVLALDVLKGFLPVAVFLTFAPTAALAVCAAVVVGHCFPIWLKFHGGRGLATATGAMLIVNPLVVLVWVTLFGVGMMIKRHVHVGNIVATLGTLICMLLVPISLIQASTLALTNLTDYPNSVRVTVVIMLAVIFIRHIEPMKALLSNKTA